MDTVHESRHIWLILALSWLDKQGNYIGGGDIDGCLTAIEIDSLNKEAATLAFWFSYIPSVLPFVLSDAQEQRINSLLNLAIDEVGDSEKGSRYYVKFMLCGILALHHIRPGQPFAEFPSVVRALELAEVVRFNYSPDAITDMVDNPSTWGYKYFNADLFVFSAELVSAITSAALSRVFYEKGEYEKAFQKLNSAAWSLCATTINIENESGVTAGFIPYLPHTLESFSVQEAANLFEELKRHSKDVGDWGAIRTCCDVMQYLGYNGLYDWLSDITDSNNDTFGAAEYWGKAITYAEVQLSLMTSPVPLLTWDAKEKSDTSSRLKRDFFPSSWESLSKKSQELLVDAEIEWMHYRLDNMIKDLRPMLESELLAALPFIQHVTAMNDFHLIATRIRDELKYSPKVRSVIDSLKLNNDDKKWLKNELWHILHDVVDTRNFFEKEQTKHDKKSEKYRQMEIRATNIHHLLLGIGCVGALQRILKIKKAIQPI